MKKLSAKSSFIALILIFVLPYETRSSAQSLYNKGNNYQISHEEKNDPQRGWIRIEYKSADFLIAEKNKELDNRMADVRTRERTLSDIPRGGFIIISIQRLTIDAANTEMFEYVIMEGEKEIYRKQGKFDIPEAPTRSLKSWWWNTDVVGLRKAIDSNIKLYVIDKLGGRDVFSISKPAGLGSTS
jgi:hypothetical protein